MQAARVFRTTACCMATFVLATILGMTMVTVNIVAINRPVPAVGRSHSSVAANASAGSRLDELPLSPEQHRQSSPWLVDHKRNRDMLGMVVLNTPPGYPLWGHLSVDNKQAYADRHGYGMYFQTSVLDQSRPPAWSKIIALQHLIRQGQHKWLWSLDMDTVITNYNKTVTDLIDDRYDLIVARDCNDINTGSFLIKASNWSLGFLEEVYKHEHAQPREWWENAAIIEVLKDERFEAKTHVKLISQKLLNSYHPVICGENNFAATWEEGDLVIHFPSLTRWEGFPDMFKEYCEKVIQ
ncbi:hypothetical protein BC831DRAFT_479337 [Entophlyctis helioformis]|nr:hypothetical protein BC831DRAFT_479337 [Entophlyctis helioformis]